MKKYYYILMPFLIAILLCSCSNSEMTQTHTTNTTTIETLTKENEEFSVKTDYESFDRYQIGNGESKFDLFFQQNIIDKNYTSELSNATTTQEFIAVEKKYLGIWQEELKKSIDSFQLILSDSEKESLVQTQKEWEDWYLENYPDAIENATDKAYDMLLKHKMAMESIDRELVKAYMTDLVLVRSRKGLIYHDMIL